jgi:hypothetical protein
MTGFQVARAGAILGVAWGGSRFFCVDPDGYLVEIEEPG